MKLLKFEQNVCPYCRQLDAFLEHDLGIEVDKTYNLDTLTDDEKIEAIEFEIMSTPVLILVDGEGKEVARVNGFSNQAHRDQVTEMVKQRGLI